jgi:hypothetical protein
MRARWIPFCFLILPFFNAHAAGGGSEAHGMPDLGYFACVDDGGSVFQAKLNTDPDSFCKIGEAVVDTYTLYGAESETPSLPQAISAFLAANAPAPQAECASWAAQLDIFEEGSNSKLDVCAFQDGSKIALETLRNGSRFQGNLSLSELFDSPKPN